MNAPLVIHRYRNGKLVEVVPAVVPTSPAERWPLAFRPLRLLARKGDRGLGDIVERTVGPLGGEAFKAWHLRLMGKPCGCNARREAWNERYPL